MTRPRIVSVVGTRPEAVKMAPVLLALARRADRFESVLVSTAQHREMLDQVLGVFGLVPEVDLGVMRPDQTLFDITERALEGTRELLDRLRPDLLLVQGDTTTVFAASLAAFYLRVPVGHVEAGLRSWDLANPFPEEANRRFTDAIATLHFAPTAGARDNLLREGVRPAQVHVTGNTVVDALQLALTRLDGLPVDPALKPALESGARLVAVTAHRRENHGPRLVEICLGLRRLVERFPDVAVVYPVHLNPNVQRTVREVLEGVPRVFLVPPLDYWSFVRLLAASDVILTDSGGVQEEAPSLGKPVLVLREVTERPEAVDAGLARVIGTDAEVIVAETARLLTDPAAYRRMTEATVNPFGDGTAGRRIVQILAEHFS
jgi:UDP-N-acetylglucosamine 2-epimerase (non-hydrolysing)